jgi:hypothetical protein
MKAIPTCALNLISMFLFFIRYLWFPVKNRLLQHTNSQLETFWTLQVRVVIIVDELYQTSWYKNEELIPPKKTIHPQSNFDPINGLYEFSESVLSASQSVLDTNSKTLSASWHQVSESFFVYGNYII